jgi:hypothetical protein
MRKLLQERSGQRKIFRATFSRFGKKINYRGYSETTILLTTVIDIETNKIVADHVWFSYTKGFEKANLTEGDQIEFNARVKEYQKGYVNHSYKINNRKKDFKLSNPTNIHILKKTN